jgi:hypothetical protein
MADREIKIEEAVVVGRRLGRHVQHDDRSKAFRARMATAIVTASHTRRCDAYDQGELGSCTGNAIAGGLMTDPEYRLGRELGEPEAVRLYSVATTYFDTIPGGWPPDDTGSTGLAVAKAAKNEGFVSSYGWAFGLDEALRALVVAPIIIGINWYSSFDFPSSTGNISITRGAYVRGGHEVVLDRLNVSKRTVGGCNSWGTSWGVNGRFKMGWATLDRLLKEQGDATQFVSV